VPNAPTTNNMNNGNMQPTTFSDEWFGVSGFFGAGYRLATATVPARFTLGIAPGAVVRALQFNDNYQCQGTCMDSPGNNIGLKLWAAPGFHADIGLLVGDTPGRKFVLGFDVWADFPSKQTVGPDVQSPFPQRDYSLANKSLVIAQGPEVVFGPTIGMRLGH
jgi:hypothetical protein